MNSVIPFSCVQVHGCTMSYNCAGGWQDRTDGKGAFAMSIQVLKSFAWACIYICGSNYEWGIAS